MNRSKQMAIAVVALALACGSTMVSSAHAAGEKDFTAGLALYKSKDYLGAYVKWRNSADAGNAGATFNIGFLLEKGFGVKKDDVASVRWYRKAADLGNVQAMYVMGLRYAAGRGIKEDQAEAVRWYRKAADLGNMWAMNNLAVRYANGKGIEKDEAEAVRLYLKAAEKGNAVSMFNMGVRYENGRGVTKDKDQATKWYKKALAGGHTKAKAALDRLSGKLKPKPAPKITPKTTTRPTKPKRNLSPGPILGEIRIVGFNFAPRGWAFCDGQILPINQNQSLFSILGTTYGGDGRTSFGLPDLRGRSPVNVGGLGNQKIRHGQKLGALQVEPAKGQTGVVTNPTHGLRYVIALQGLFPSRTKSNVGGRFTGEIIMFAGNFSPNGWAACDGKKLAVADYKALYQAIGKTYGGDDKQFSLPDLRGRVMVHAGRGPGLVAAKIGEKGGGKKVTRHKTSPNPVTTAAYLGIHHVIVQDGVDPAGNGGGVEQFVGEVRILAGKSTPRGWAACDGQLLAVSQNDALFSLFGTLYGGDGRSTFGLPGLRGRSPVHCGQGPGLSVTMQGSKQGGNSVTVTTDDNKSTTLQPTLVTRYIVGLVGIYPSRN
jgi:microcystin-dependent protein/TPR repeat protein